MRRTSRSFLIRIVTEDRAPLILEFHRSHLTEYLWPRTRQEFEQLANDECLYEAVETTTGEEEIVGICYVMHGNEPDPPHAERSEFGGIFMTDACRGLGVATALGIVGISNHFALDPPRGRLIAHVHEKNQLPRGVLQGQLGFAHAGQETPPANVAPPTIARNERGEVVGDLFEFKRQTLLRFADWIEGFDGMISGKTGTSKLDIAMPLLTKYRSEAVEALRALGTNR